MKRVAWLTDIHLDFLDADQRRAFIATVDTHKPDCVLLGGDIGQAGTVVDFLAEIENGLTCPIYFVLGNHDFYHGEIAAVRAKIEQLVADSARLVWLNHSGIIELTENIAIIGHDSWADGRCGNYARSTVMLNDYIVIRDFAWLDKQQRLAKIQSLADEAVEHFRNILPQALERYPQVVLLTHVPPFRESCWHQGKISDDNWLPHFSSQVVGDALLEIMSQHPQGKLTVLCGHTHGAGEAQIADNLLVLTGGARYYEPEVQRIFEW